jgi:hypothetical protein
MAALVIMDAVMAQYARQYARSLLPPLKAMKPAGETIVGGDKAAEKLKESGVGASVNGANGVNGHQ